MRAVTDEEADGRRGTQSLRDKYLSLSTLCWPMAVERGQLPDSQNIYCLHKQCMRQGVSAWIAREEWGSSRVGMGFLDEVTFV